MATYKVKTIEFLRRQVPIVLQNENGPCPLLAVANILLLRNLIYLPANTPEVSQDRLISLIAGYLLDANSDERLASAGEEYKANLQQNLSDAMALLPKLTTGIDVNVRFNSTRDFEFTQETAIFDLLDIRLVHGWLIDPQDKATVQAIQEHSYNELVSLLVNTLGDETPSHLLTPTAVAHSREASFSKGPSQAPQRGTSTPGAPSRLAADAAQSQSGSTLTPDKSPQPGRSSSRQQEAHLTGVDSQELLKAIELSMAATSLEESRAAASQASSAEQPTDEADSLPGGPVATSQPLVGDRATLPGGAIGKPLPQTTSQQPPAVDLQRTSDSQTTAGPAVAAEGGLGKAEALARPDPEPGLRHSLVAARPPEPPAPAFQPPAEGLALSGPSSEAEPLQSGRGAVEAGLGGVEKPARFESGGVSGVGPSDQERGPEASGSGQARKDLGSAADVEASSSGTANPGWTDPRPQPSETVTEYDDAALAKGKMPAFVDVDPDQFFAEQQGGAKPRDDRQRRLMEQSPTPHVTSEDRARQLQQAHTVQTFLEGTSSQLTEHGLLSLHQDLRPNELAILFRNNHLNTIFLHNDAIWILVTDLGYLFEQNVVWERLSDVSGNTDFAKADFSSFAGQPTTRDVTVAADLAQAAFASVVAPKGLPDPGAKADPDADMALALQLQEQEVFERQRHEQELEATKGAPQAQGVQQKSPRQRPPQSAQTRQTGTQRREHAKPTKPKPVKPKEEKKCILM